MLKFMAIKNNNFLKVIFISLFTFSAYIYAVDMPSKIKLSAKQILNVGIGSEVPSLDPQKIQDSVSSRVGNDLFEGLAVENEKGLIVPGIAEKWDISKDGLTYVFYIRPNAKFSDGSNITADDVIFSIRRLVDPKTASPYADLISMVKNAKNIANGKAKPEELGIKALGKNIIQIILEKPTPYFLKIVAFQNLTIVKKANVEKFGDQFTQPGNLVSSGAYILKYWKIGDKITAEKNKQYWNSAKTTVETVNYFPISDVNTELQMYQTGQIDFTYDIPPEKFKELRKTIGKELRSAPYLSIYYIDLNNSVAPFKNNLKLRQALAMSIDKKIIAEKVTGRGEIPSYDIVPFGVADYKQQNYTWENLSIAQRILEAQKLYKEAGYSREKPLIINYSYNTNALHKKIAIAIASMWEQNLGVKVSLINQEWKVFLTERMEGRYVVARDGWIADYNDASTFLDMFQSNHPQNNSKYKNPKYDALIKLASIEENKEKRRKIFAEASAIMMNDYPVIPLYTYVTTHLVKSYVGGYTGENPLDHVYTKNLYIIDKK